MKGVRLELAVLFALVLPFARAQAQGGPVVTITPASGTYTSPTVSNIDIKWCSDQPLNDATRSITLDGVDVSASFSTTPGTGATGCIYGAHSYGSVTLTTANDGVHTLSAAIEDIYSYYGGDSQTYTYRWPGYVPARYSVSVWRGGASAIEAQPGASRSTTFTVRNDGSRPANYTIAAHCRGGATSGGSCTPSPASVSLDTTAAGRVQTVTVSFSAGATPSDTGSVTLVATNALGGYPYSSDVDSVTTDVGVAITTPNNTALVDIVGGGATLRRDLCLTVSAGSDAAYQCGDLRIVHPLPSVTTRGVTRTPALIYTSSQGPASALVSADVTIPSGYGAVSQVSAVVRNASGSVVGSGSWAGSDWGSGAGVTRRITLQPNFGDATQLNAYTLEVTYAWTAGGSTMVSTSGEVATVSRNSNLGKGWWIAGVEQLVGASGGTLLWVGGDGSTTKYVPAGTNLWRAANVDHPDSLLWNGSVYVRRLQNGTEIHFDASGHHARTKPLIGASTYFFYSGNNLEQIWLPAAAPDGTLTLRYVFTPAVGYTTAAIYGIPDGPTAFIYLNGAGQVTQITDWNERSVTFGYTSQLLTRRTDRRGYATNFTFDAGGKLIRHALASGGTYAKDFVPAETRGLTTAVALDSAYALIDGPRSDVADITRVWPSRFGPPSRVQGPDGHDTRVTFDATWPGLPSQVTSPTGVVTNALYDGRGLLQTSTVHNARYAGDASSSTYVWDARFAKPTQITGPSGEQTLYSYDANGNVEWMQVGTNASARTYAYYTSAGQYAYSLVPGRTERDSVVYDGVLGNPVRFRDRRGNWTSTVRDSLGRPRLDSTQVSAGVWRADSTEYDRVDRVIRQVSFGPATSYSPLANFSSGFPNGNTSIAAQTLYVRNSYDEDGNVTEVARWGVPNPTAMDTAKTSFTYDGAGRKTGEGSNATGDQIFTYDPAGNLIQRSNALSTISMQYDEIGRLRSRTASRVNYPIAYCPSANPIDSPACNFYFPLVTGGASGLAIDGDSARFDYDRGGNMIRADNQHAKVRRSYAPGGMLLSDTLRIRTLRYVDNGSVVPAVDFTHAYGLTLTYDASGRRAGLQHPSQFACGTPCVTQQYGYETTTGRLSSLTDVRGQTFGFTYTLAGQLDYLTYPGGVSEHPVYDPEGLPQSRTVSGPGVSISDQLTYDPLGRITRADGLLQNGGGGSQHTTNWYAGLGALAATQHEMDGAVPTLEEFRFDALANQYLSKRHHLKLANPDYDPASRTLTFDLAGHVVRDTAIVPSPDYDHDSYQYDSDGNLRYRYTQANNSSVSQFVRRQEAHYYDGLGKLVLVERHSGEGGQASTANDPQALIERYRYDALGRRVLTHTLRAATCAVNGCESTLQRTIWDGDQVLYETRAPGSDATLDAVLESDTPGGNGEYGAYNAYGVVGYTHAGGIDRPIGARRLSSGSVLAAFYPQTNWRGQYELATLDNGTKLTNDVAWPGMIGSAFLGATPRATPYEWFGNLMTEQADASGLLYRRNRYYDPKSGRFTQPDPIGIAGGLNAYGFASGDPINFSDPFGLFACPPDCDNSDGLGWARYAGGMLTPAQRPLEVAGAVVTAPLAGGMGMAGGISGEVLALGATLRSGAGSGILTAAGVAQRVATAVGGTVSELSKSEGFKVTVQASKNIVARIKSTGEMRVGIDRVGSLTADGAVSSDRALTHLRNLSSQNLIDLVNRARQLVGAPR